jgi:hypothetical protein
VRLRKTTGIPISNIASPQTSNLDRSPALPEDAYRNISEHATTISWYFGPANDNTWPKT